MYSEIELIQRHQLDGLLDHSYHTAFGRHHKFQGNWSYRQFAKQVPVTNYTLIKPYIELIKAGKADQLWEGKTRRFAVSSGTYSNGKHLPVTEERLHSDQLFLRQVSLDMLKWLKHPGILFGKQISLPGTITRETNGTHQYEIGEISGHLALNAPKWLDWFQAIPVDQLVQLPFEKKFNMVINNVIRQDIRIISAVPTWLLTLFQGVLDRTGKNSIHEVWPNLKVLICGGVALKHYAPVLQELCGSINPMMVETYGASEGFFAYGKFNGSGSLQLVVDNGIFYEWRPQDVSEQSGSKTNPIPTWQAETGRAYEMLVSTNAGLWRYPVGDIIEFQSFDPPVIKIKGRKKEILDSYGEALTIIEAESVLSSLSSSLDFNYQHLAIGTIPPSSDTVPYHHWFIFSDDSLDKKAAFIQAADQKLRNQNRHYAIRRNSGALGPPNLTVKPVEYLHLIHANTQKAQSKPRKIIDEPNVIKQLQSFD